MGDIYDMFGFSILCGLIGCTILLCVLWYFEEKQYNELYGENGSFRKELEGEPK